METIETLLHRRADLSTFLVHLTRDGPERQSARANLAAILTDCCISAQTARGMAKDLEPQLAGTFASQKVVCFTETPLEHAWMMVQDIEGRDIQFSPHGLVFTKTTARKARCNPVWYIDISTRDGWDWRTKPVDKLVEQARVRALDDTGKIDTSKLAAEPILQITPFFEQMGPINKGKSKKEFWWEREWRHVDHFRFSPSQVVALLAPEADQEWLRSHLLTLEPWAKRDTPLLDPVWGLERMVAAMSGVDPEQFGPFPEA